MKSKLIDVELKTLININVAKLFCTLKKGRATGLTLDASVVLMEYIIGEIQ